MAAAAAGSDAVKPSIDAGDRAWSRRAEGAEGDRAAPGPIADAIAAYEAAIAADPRNLEASWKLARALHFQGEFTAMPAADRERLWERGTELAERSLAVLHGDRGWQDREPSTVAAEVEDRAVGAAVHFWAALHWGLWGETKGSMAAVHKGIAKRIRDHALVAIALDETCERGGPRRLLGRLHAVAPRVPFFTGWVSRAEAIEQLERAVAIAPESLANRLFLAEARLELEPALRDQALLEIEARDRRRSGTRQPGRGSAHPGRGARGPRASPRRPALAGWRAGSLPSFNQRPSPLDPGLLGKTGQHLAHGAAVGRKRAGGVEVGEGLQHEAALAQQRVRQP